ncbi:class I SAM-dependent methyltransferase [Aspergillus lucknowensis]|uniref:S-adenosyl-L-methionine-dependent methyltransferase n=1 Tax=Aspergillus lucknowensis TaxID=176173 RepID=A0ABR4LCZ0_9EURO
MAERAPPYLLAWDYPEAVRLESQHLLWKLHTGYTLHPSIPITDDMSIADLGPGTGIWALELASELPATAHITGYDFSDLSFPVNDYWPENVSLEILNCLGEIPDNLVAQFDVVHLRMWAFVIRGNDPSTLIRNAVKMLKPGGYLQWEDARFNSVVMRGEAATRIREMMRAANRATNTDFRWLDSLQTHLSEATRGDLETLTLKQTDPWSAPYLIPLCTDSFMLALESSGKMLDRLQQVSPLAENEDVPSQAEWNAALAALREELKRPESEGGGQFHWLPVTYLGRKRGIDGC